jgi:hypothetical protein
MPISLTLVIVILGTFALTMGMSYLGKALDDAISECQNRKRHDKENSSNA